MVRKILVAGLRNRDTLEIGICIIQYTYLPSGEEGGGEDCGNQWRWNRKLS